MVLSNKSKLYLRRVQWLNTGLCGTAIVQLSSENSFVLLLDREWQNDGDDSEGRTVSHIHWVTQYSMLSETHTDKDTDFHKAYFFLPVFLFFGLH